MNLKLVIIFLAILILLAGVIYTVVPPQDKPIKDMSQDNSFSNPNILSQNKTDLIIRQPAVAGQFYPADKEELEGMVEGFLDQVEIEAAKSRPRILIAPHAGYVFSGQTAAYSFKSIQNEKYSRVILLGNSHQTYFDGLFLDGSDVWQTPLGQVEVDQDAIQQLIGQNNKIKINRQVHLAEHSLEVEVPFLQKALSKANFKIVPGLFGSHKNLADLKSISQSLATIIDDKTLVVISTDLSHYPNFEDAKSADQKTIQAILAGGPEEFLRLQDELIHSVPNLSTGACGWPAVAMAMMLANELNLKGELLNYTNSGEVPVYGDQSRVVGYASIVYKIQNPKLETQKLNQEEQQAALRLARNTLARAFDKEVAEYEEYKKLGIFQQKRGVFVTLRKNGKLRGCIGLIEPPAIPLAEAIKQMALAAAFNDSRFPPLVQDELSQIEIEISVLSAPRRVASADEIELGKHGVIVKKGERQGVFLPQVAEETGWTKEEFLSQLCSQKAGLSSDCWQDAQVELYVFEAQVF